MPRPCFSAASSMGCFVAGLILSAAAASGLSAAEPKIAPRPAGEAVRVPVSRDLWISSVDQEVDGNNGGSPKLKFKSYQEFSLVDFDPAPFRGRIVLGATLHLRLAGEERLHRMTVGGVAGEWVEGTGSGYQSQEGSSTFRSRRHPAVRWGADGGDVTSAIFGQAGQPWASVDAVPPDADGWQRIAVDPRVLKARIAGLSQGFAVFDDTGSEWRRDGEKYTSRHFPNRFVHSRESNRQRAPYWTVYLGGEDKQPPAAVAAIEIVPAASPSDDAFASWKTPADVGESGTVGFFVNDSGQEVDRAWIPAAGTPGSAVRMILPATAVRPGPADDPKFLRAAATLTIRAVDGAGNVSAPFTQSVKLPKPMEAPPLPVPTPFVPLDGAAASAPWPKAGGTSIAAIDPLDKVDLRTGALVPKQGAGYWLKNHLWDAKARTIRLAGARRERVAFQLAITPAPKAVAADLKFTALAERPRVRFHQYEFVPGKGGVWADPLLPFVGGEPASAPGKDASTWAFLLCELDLAADMPPGNHIGELLLTLNGEKLPLRLELEAFDFEMPPQLSFLPEMNCYDLPADERSYYRLAQENRTVLNRLPYHQNGRVEEGCAPKTAGEGFDWKGWDQRFGPLLDGSLFADLPRGAVPVECLYLPIHENWPVPIEPAYNGDDWANRAFTPEYRRRIVQASKSFAEHLSSLKAERTLFHFFLNGKNDFKRQGWFRGSSPWLLDEPASFQDFYALRWFGEAFLEGAAAAKPSARMVFRADVSRPQWQRDSLDDLLDYNVVAGGPNRVYGKLVAQRKAREGQVVVEYGTANPLEANNQQAVGWSLAAWIRGADGVLPWQTIGKDKSWTEADPLSLFYPKGEKSPQGPAPSIRLKGFLRGQQDVEYVELWRAHFGIPRERLAHELASVLNLEETHHVARLAVGEDAGSAAFDALSPAKLAAFRLGLGRALSKLRPTAKPQPVVERLRTRTKIVPLDWEVLPAVGERPDQGRAGHYHPGPAK